MWHRVLVCGGRDYNDRWKLESTLDIAHAEHGFIRLIHGAAPGADTLAGDWADKRGLAVVAYPADWKRHGKAAGPMRNQRMLEDGRPDVVIAFPGGSGTADMVRRAKEAGIPVIEVRRSETVWS